MSKLPRKLTDLSLDEQKKFLESFDKVFSDMDGCLWEFGGKSIPGAPEAINGLRSIGKECSFITNSCIIPLKYLLSSRMKDFKAAEKEIIRPSSAIIWYLNKINFNKEIYVVGVKTLKEDLKQAGFKVVCDEAANISEDIQVIIETVNRLRPEVGAVLIDFPFNMDFIILQKCVEYVKKNDAILIAGAYDPVIQFADISFVGAPFYIETISEITGKKPLIFSKPGDEFNEHVKEMLGPFEPKRVLFIGDSPNTDMAFATKFGYQKLLPLTGLTTKNDLENWTYKKEWKPDYYVDSLKDIETVLNNLKLEKQTPKL